MHPAPLAIATASLVAALLFALVARATLRAPARAGREARGALACAWAGMAFLAASDGARILIGNYLPGHFVAYSTLAMLKIIANGVTIWALGVWIAHLWLGHARGWRLHLGLYAAAHSLFFLWTYQARAPVATNAEGWVPRLVFDGPAVLPPALGAIALGLYFIPPLVLVMVLGARARALPHGTARGRLRATAIAMAGFHVANMYQSNPYIPGESLIFPTIAALTVAAAALAYRVHGTPWNPPAARTEPRPQARSLLGDTLK